MKKYLKILFLLFSLILLSCENSNKDKPIIYLGENNVSKGDNLPDQLYKIGDRFKLLKQNN